MRNGKNPRRAVLLLAVCVPIAGAGVARAVDVFSMPTGEPSVVMRPVGNRGNAADPTTGFGGIFQSFEQQLLSLSNEEQQYAH